MASLCLLFFFLLPSILNSLKFSRSCQSTLGFSISNKLPISSSSSFFRLHSASGAALELKNVFISIGNNDIISNINWAIMPKERWALVGPNGAGKSTLLKALTKTGGETLTVREGNVVTKPKARVGYLEQKGVSGSTKTVREEVSSRMDRLTDAQKALEHAEKLVAEGDTSDEALKMLEDASVEFEAAGGFTVEQKISNVLKGLGFLMEEYDKRCDEFSGGWQMRIALARLLLSEPDILILDEPTNHLDKGARNWLAGYLAAYDKTVLLVSHDVNLLKTAVNSIAEVRKGTVELYKSRSYDQWQVERDERVKIAKAEYEANMREIERLQSFVDRFGAKTMGASLAQSKLKTIEKIEANMAPEAPTDADRPPPSLVLPKPPRGSKVLLEMKNAVISWTPKSPDNSAAAAAKSTPIITDCTITIERGMRIAVRGPNGAGKTTFLSALSGRLPISSGQRVLGDGLELGTFTQDLAQDLDQTQTAVNVVASNVRQRDATISDERIRNVLGALGLMQDKSTRLVGFLSGGEKARVALASFVLLPHNLLLLDEPSNHLDEPTLRVLTKALREFEGSCVVISHDRLFLEELEPTHVLTVRNGAVTMEERGLRESDWADDLYARTEFLLSSASTGATTSTTPAASVKTTTSKTTTSSSTSSSAASKGSNKQDSPQATTVTTKGNSGANSKQLTKLEMNIARLEKEMVGIDNEMIQNGADSSKLMELQLKKDRVQVKMDKLYAELEQLVG